jgi:hypothetical protein
MSRLVMEVEGRSWRTPLTGPTRQSGSARLLRSSYSSGLFPMEGIGGYEVYEVVGRLPVMALQRRTGKRGGWQTWMVDDPLHWLGMEERVEDLPGGRILVAGLGLGLMLHHMASRDRFEAIDVIEIDWDVVELIGPTLPDDPRVTIVVDDWNRYVSETSVRYDGVLWDLAVGSPHETIVAMTQGRVMAGLFLPGAKLVRFGMRKEPASLEAALLRESIDRSYGRTD